MVSQGQPARAYLCESHTLRALYLRATLGPRIAWKSMTEANVEGSLIVGEIRETVNSNLANFQRDLDAI